MSTERWVGVVLFVLYCKDLGHNKAYALVENLANECVHSTLLTAYPVYLEEAIDAGVDFGCDLAICGVDNKSGTHCGEHLFPPSPDSRLLHRGKR